MQRTSPDRIPPSPPRSDLIEANPPCYKANHGPAVCHSTRRNPVSDRLLGVYARGLERKPNSAQAGHAGPKTPGRGRTPYRLMKRREAKPPIRLSAGCRQLGTALTDRVSGPVKRAICRLSLISCDRVKFRPRLTFAPPERLPRAFRG
jgi:hypothetical protein